MKKIVVFCFVILILTSSSIAYAGGLEDQVPEKVKVISQSCMAEALCVTVIDLENNEIVILYYIGMGNSKSLTRGKLRLNDVTRTGMFVEPTEQESITGQDAPFDEQKNQENDKFNQNDMNNNF